MVTLEQIADEASLPTPESGSQQGRQWSTWIADALLQVSARAGDVSGLDQDMLEYVVRMAVAAKVKRPDSATQVDVSVDDARVSRRYESSTGQVTILPEWWALLGIADESGAFTVTPSFDPDVWVLP